MKLLIDLGNSRIKACVSDPELKPIAEVVDLKSLAAWVLNHCQLISSVAIASVASAQKYADVMGVLGRHFDEQAIYRACYNSRLLPTRYQQPERLGIDRWLALLPCRHRSSAIVVDAGTAFTLDVLCNAQHVGGYILPGLRLQHDVLASQTAAVSFPQTELDGTVLGHNTATCVGHGAIRAFVALIEAVREDYREQAASVIITGGDAHYLQRHISAEWRPLLVFEGLMIALTAEDEAKS